nr:hypothetical protein JVH1_4094 [Rhodococcus sp. JVH1]
MALAAMLGNSWAPTRDDHRLDGGRGDVDDDSTAALRAEASPPDGPDQRLTRIATKRLRSPAVNLRPTR